MVLRKSHSLVRLQLFRGPEIAAFFEDLVPTNHNHERAAVLGAIASAGSFCDSHGFTNISTACYVCGTGDGRGCASRHSCIERSSGDQSAVIIGDPGS